MIRFLFAIGLLIFINSNCSEKYKSAQPSPNFKSFEISYADDRGKHFSFMVGADKIYISPIGFEGAKYGILPDSLYNLINSSFLKIHYDKTIKSKDDSCEDCDIVAIEAITSNDTVIINQTGDINKDVLNIAFAIRSFLDSNRHGTFSLPICRDTRAIVSRLPLPIMEDVKFKIRKHMK